MSNNRLANIIDPSSKRIHRAVSEELKSFIDHLFPVTNYKYATFTFTIDAIDPLAYLEMCWKTDTYHYYWEKAVDNFAIAAGDELLNISENGADRFSKTNKSIHDLKQRTAEFSAVSHPYAGLFFTGGFSFFDKKSGAAWNSFEPASLSVPRWLIIKDGKFTLATVAVSLENYKSPGALFHHLKEELAKLTSNIDIDNDSRSFETNTPSVKPVLPHNGSKNYDQWMDAVQKAKKHIADKCFNKIVLARRLTVSHDSQISPTHIINNLRQQYSNCYNFLIHRPSGDTFLGSTPERLGAFRNRLLLTEALAGSIKRGRTATEDTMLENSLYTSQKNRDEHNFVIKAIEERLHSYVESIQRSSQPEIKKLSNVQHLYTPIRAKLKKSSDILDIIGQLHPTPAVGGYPWKNARSYLEELEDFDRGWYAGPVGWLNGKGTGEFAVAIRSGLLTDTEAHFFAGCGIVADSDPAAEWEETNLKLKPMLSALQYD